MPIYEYECRSCGERFEALVNGSDKAACPACQGAELDRMLSVFAVGANGAKSSVSASSARAFIGKLYPRAPIAGNRTARPSAKRELMTGLSMMTWLMRYAFFDLTTTGLPRSHQRPYPR